MNLRAGGRAAAYISLVALLWGTQSIPALAQDNDTDVAACAALSREPQVVVRFEPVPTTLAASFPGEPPATLPPHCRVEGVLQPVAGSRIGYVLLLPLRADWTGRYQMLGNGGYSSRLPMSAMAKALAHGSAAIATDTGHQGEDPDFALGRPEAIVDWGWRAVHLTALAGKTVVTRFYGRPARYSYFAGCSTGGHQAMMEAQRFPEDFDGIVAGAPGADRVRLNAAFLWQFLSNHDDGPHPVLYAADLNLLQANARTQCRSSNGGKAGGLASDSWINDPLSCKPDLQKLACGPGRSLQCLTPAKIAVARMMYTGAVDMRNGANMTFPWLPGSESGWQHYWADPSDPTRPMRVNFWRVWAFGNPTWSWHSFDYGRDLPAVQARLSPIIDATSPDLSAFRSRGGRLLQYHGLDDPVVSPLDTLDKRHAMLKRTGSNDDWQRLFLIPGMQHCAGGDGFTRFDTQWVIERWVEQGEAPARIVAQDAAGRSRPLCPYPARAVLTGERPDDASSFTCTPSNNMKERQ